MNLNKDDKDKEILEVQVDQDTSKSKDDIPQKSTEISFKKIMECKSSLVNPEINIGLFPVKIPVIITELLVHIDIESKINLPKPASYIKSIKRKVFIKECNLISNINKLFLNGVVKKSIEYSEAMDGSASSMEGQIKNIIVEIPFNCVTEIKYIIDPVVPKKNYKNGIKVYSIQSGEQTFYESYSESDKIFCEVIHASFEEVNIEKNKGSYTHLDKKDIFRTINQKMFMHLNIRLIQNQNIYVASRLH